MKDGRYEILYKVVRIANSSLGFSRGCKSILRYLQQVLTPQSLSFFLLDDRQTSFSHKIDAAGSALLQPCVRPLAGLPEELVLQNHKALRLGGTWHFPVVDGRQNLGVVALQMLPDQQLSDEVSDIFRIVGEELARLFRYENLLQARDDLETLAQKNDCKLQEAVLLYRISRAIHGTLNLNELMHLILSVAVTPGGGGFERAMLFTINERTETLQGILCVSRETAAFVLPQEKIERDRPIVSAAAQKAQRQSACCQKVMKQRLPLDSQDNPLARCVKLGQAIFEPYPEDEMAGMQQLIEAVDLGPFACAPLIGRDKALGVLLVDNPLSHDPLSPDRRRFFELFASQAGSAMENSMLLHRLESAHQDLRETQARLIHGEKMATLGEMAASIAHELRNPLVPIGGFAERLGRLAQAGSREQEYTEIIIREVRRMEKMLDNILVFSKKQMLCFSETHVAEIIAEAFDLESEALAGGDIHVVREIAVDLPVLFCDHQKLRQVLTNLITNARQAMPSGGTLVLRVKRGKLRGEAAIEIEIEDSGGGIPVEILPNLFSPFFTTKEKGTGLGLSISQRIVEHHRGEIEVKNQAKGAVFILRLPAQPNGKA